MTREGKGGYPEAICERYHFSIPLGDLARDLPVSLLQQVEIVKVLYKGADIIILDEPTAVLTPQEIHELMEIMRNLTKEGKTIILITHKLKEIKEVADVCTVLRRGRCMGTIQVAETSEEEMAKLMVGGKSISALRSKLSSPARSCWRSSI